MSGNRRWLATLALLVCCPCGFSLAEDAAEAVKSYHPRRALFRCEATNRGLAFDGQHFWVGQYGGRVRCYDRDGQPVPSRDLGDSSIPYLGHGVAVLPDGVVCGARDFLAILPFAGGPMRKIAPALPGPVCAVASNGKTQWAMNHESPELYEMDLDGKLLRQFTTAQKPSPTSRTITLDCDGHLYVIQNAEADGRVVLEYTPEGKLVNTHTLAFPATSVAIDPKDPEKTLYAVSFAGDSTVYEYRLAPGRPADEALPRLARLQRYRPEGKKIVIENGPFRFNRALYGTNTAFYVSAGDLPEILLSLPGKGGTLWLGIVQGDKSKWLSLARRIVTRCRGGAVSYEIQDDLLGAGRLSLDVIPSATSEGVALRIAASQDTNPVELVWAFGGASGFGGWNFDTAGYCPESACWLKPEDCENNQFTLAATGFQLQAPCHKSRPIAGTVPPGSQMQLSDADQLSSPQTLLGSTGQKRPILAGRRPLAPGETLHFALERPAKGASAGPADPKAFYEAADAANRELTQRVRVETPDPWLNAAVPMLCSAADGLWDPPTYSHGGVAWHMPYLGWRGAYIASEFGWHDRAKEHFRAFAKVQLKTPEDGKPHADPKYNLARQAPDSVIFSRGYIPVHPTADARGPYDMQQVFIDQLLRHLMWTGDLEFAREMWPVIVDHLGWERRCFDPDGDGLYENVANTLISDAHHYSGGACTQASAYDYWALVQTARLARLLGEDPKPFQREAEKTWAAMNQVLWMPQRGWFAEYRDLLGLKRLHPSAELPSIYHPIDSELPDMFQAWQMLRYVDTDLEHVPVSDDASLVWTSNWVPWIWSVRDILHGEVTHLALANWQAGRRQAAMELLRGAILDPMYCGRVPGNTGGTSDLSMRNPGACTDFCCSVGMLGRALVEGLFGIVPDALEGELLIRPGLPADWPQAAIDTPDVGYSYSRQDLTESFAVRARLPRPLRLRLQVAARADQVADVIVNGEKVAWRCVPRVGEPTIEILAPQADGAQVEISWKGTPPVQPTVPAVVGQGEALAVSVEPARLVELLDPQTSLSEMVREPARFQAKASGACGHRTVFAQVEQGGLSWFVPVTFEIRPPLELVQTDVDWDKSTVRFALRNNTAREVNASAKASCGTAVQSVALQVPPQGTSAAVELPAQGLVPGTNPLLVELPDGATVAGKLIDWRSPEQPRAMSWECVDLTSLFNDRVTQIFQHEYRSPRSPYCSMQIPLYGFGDWCYGGRQRPTIDDAALRQAAGAAGRLVTPQGIPFATPGPGNQPNVLFTSQWDNFPRSADVPLSGRASHGWFLVAGSTHPMHSQLDNGEIVVTYADGSTDRLALHNPSTWWPIEADYDLRVDGFCVPKPYPPRIPLGSGMATLLDLPMRADRELRSVTIRCLANEVVVGLMGMTLLRP